jgi:exonuclease III
MSSTVGSVESQSKDYRIVSFNVNGLRSIVEHYKVTRNWSIDQWLDSFDADIICFQETKINDVTKITPALANPHKYHAYYAFHQKNHLLEASKGGIGYAGVVTFVRKSSSHLIGPIAYEEGFTGVFCDGTSAMTVGVRQVLLQEDDKTGGKGYSTQELQQFDAEGRVIITDHRDFVVINVYCPNNSGGEVRQSFRTHFYLALWKRYYEITQSTGKPVILLGDINITPHPRDHADYASSYAELCRRYGETVIENRILEYATNHRHNEIVVKPMEEVISSYKQVLNRVMIEEEDGGANCSSSGDSIDRCIRLFFEDSPMRLWLYRELHGLIDDNSKNCHLNDSFRLLAPQSLYCYTCWDMQSSSRSINYGSRIDMAFIAAVHGYEIHDGKNQEIEVARKESGMTLLSSRLLPDIMGSDHCPIMIEIRINNPTSSPIATPVPPRNTKSFINQSKISSFFIKKDPNLTKDASDSTVTNVSSKKRDGQGVEEESSSKLEGNATKRRNVADYFKKS